MFAEEFFPTMPFVIDRMLEPYWDRITHANIRREGVREGRRPIATVLDPSAGDGAILKRIREIAGKYSQPRMLAIEISPQLAAIVQSEKFDLVAHDFLEYRPERRIDLIAMNPPFSNGDEHLMHAWEIANGTDIVCLLNAETIRNPYTWRRKALAKLIEDHGSIEYLGNAFSDSRRPTDVEIAMVRLYKPRDTSLDISFDFEPEKVVEAGFSFAQAESGADLAKPDMAAAIVRQYEMTKDAFADVLRARSKIQFFSQACTKDAWAVALKSMDNRLSAEAQFEEFKDAIRAGFWEHAFRKLGMEKYLTKGLMEKTNQFIEQQGKMAFTKENIAKMLETMMLNRTAIMQQAIEAVFNIMTKYHEDNRCHVEGWKSNEAWKVNRKVVLPFYIDATWGNFLRVSHHRDQEARDIDKVMCYLSGRAIEDIVTIHKAVEGIRKTETLGMSTFFKIRGYKKGTIHLEFLDENLWNRFNIEACKGKGWIGQQKEKA